MKNKNFFDLDHAHRYLTDSIIRYDGEPIYVENLTRDRGEIICFFRRLRNWQAIRENKLASNKFDMTPIPLGLVNFEEFGLAATTIKVSRVPRRGWKIGLNGNNVNFEALHDDAAVPRYRTLMHSTFLRDTVVNNFPSFNRVKSKVMGKFPDCMAFSRRFALDGHGRLFHMFEDKHVGSLNANGQPILSEKHEFLIQTLTEDLR